MHVQIDLARCTGHGFCEAVAEELFEVGADGVTHLTADPGDADRKLVERAVAECPTRALSIT